MSDRLEEIKNGIAKTHGYQSFEELLKDNSFGHSSIIANSFNKTIELIAKQYARECCQASLEKADNTFKNTAVKSISTALKYYEEAENETAYRRDIISFLHAFHQFEAQGLSIVGMGYKRYDGKEITDLNGAYEGGYFTEKKKCQITNQDNIVIL